jgi:hypothetical protein
MTVTHSTLYTLDMAKVISVQVKGVEKPARIFADKVEKKTIEAIGGQQEVLMLKNGNEEVGEFKRLSVDGWWIESE